MAIGFAAVGIVSYNGFVFDGTAQVRVATEYVNDEADRTVIYQRQVTTIRAIVAQDGGSDAQMFALRNLLSRQGQEFILVNHGFGADLVVNPTVPAAWLSSYRDVKFGPKPKILHWEPVGSKNACEIEFQVVTCISFCVATTPLLALNYDASYSIDAKGMTTRTISGYYEIAQTRNADRTIPKTADQYRTLIAPELPFVPPITYSGSSPLSNWVWEGIAFQRTSEWHTSLDKSREDFTITDRQIPSQHALPDYAVNARMRHRAQAKRPRRGNGGMWQRHNISMELELADGINPAISFLIFANIVNSRIAAANKDDIGATKKRVQFEEVTIEEDSFGRVSAFNIEYRVLGKINALQTFVQNSGFWTTLGTSWTTWASSMSTLFSQYGTAGIRTLAANDGITDLCGGPGSDAGPPASTDPNVNLVLPSQPTLSPIYPANQKPDPEYSFGVIRNVIAPYSRSPVTRQSILQAPKEDTASMSVGDPGTDMLSTTNFSMPDAITTDDVLQEGGGRRSGAMIVGYAERYGYEIPRPAFNKIGQMSGAKVVFEQYEEYFVANVMGVPLYRLSWAIGYDLPNSPGAVSPPRNQEQGINSNGSLIT